MRRASLLLLILATACGGEAEPPQTGELPDLPVVTVAPVPRWVEMLESDDESVRAAGIDLLIRDRFLGALEEAAPYLVPLALSENDSRRKRTRP